MTTKPPRYLGRIQRKTEVHAAPRREENMLEKLTVPALKSSPTLRWERRATHEQELPASEQGVHRQLVGHLLWIDRADLRCAMERATCNLGRASDTDLRDIKSILRDLLGNLGTMTAQPLSFNLEAAKRELLRLSTVLAMLTPWA